MSISPPAGDGGKDPGHGEYDYAAALRLGPFEPGVKGCLGCMRCKAGDHGTCHGCECDCGYRWHADYYGPGFTSPCPTSCRDWMST